MNISKKDLAKEIRCLRVHLTPTTSAHFIEVLKEAEKTVGAPIEITGFVRYKLGDGIEKPIEDFAEEVKKAGGG